MYKLGLCLFVLLSVWKTHPNVELFHIQEFKAESDWFEEPILADKTVMLEFPKFINPVKADSYVSSAFGLRGVVVKGMGGEDGDFHRGIDLVVNGRKQVEIVAAADGAVVMHYPPPAGRFRGHPVFGGLVVIHHGNTIHTVYGHLSETFVKERQYVKQGQVIGIMGNTGMSTGRHLHFEILVNPASFISF
jgi:murein DD-endopeptidase MepM/ murein hydrolase activator NlpD